MKKLMVLLIGLLIAGICGASLYLSKKISPIGVKRIAIFTPITHPALEEVERGFKETLQKQGGLSYQFTTYNANGNRTLLRAQAEELVTGSYDLIFTMGAICSQLVAELLQKKGMPTAHVFGAVDGIEIAQEIQACRAASTGVYVAVDYLREMDMLRRLKPNTKNILLVYDPTHGTGLEKHKQEIAAYIKPFSMKLQSVEIYQTNEIQQKVASLLPGMDVVLVLIDNTVVAGIDALIALCNRYGVTLLSSDLASGKKGAALAYGITEYESGSGAAHTAHAIMVEGKQPQELSISPITQFRTAINKTTMAAQQLPLSEEIIHHYEQSEASNV